jgi:hypothetical protein
VNSKIEIWASTPTLFSLSFVEGTSDEYVTHRLLPNFATFQFPDYRLMPSTKSDAGVFTIQGQLFSTEKIVSFQIKVTVINQAPTLSSGNIPDQLIMVDSPSEMIYQLADATDREGQPITI